MKSILGALLVVTLSACGQPSPAAAPESVVAPAKEALPSWYEGPTRTAIVDFVNAVTTSGSPDFVPPPERIAVFDTSIEAARALNKAK